MNQSAIIGGALLAGFALFIASRDRLSVYGRVLWGAKPEAHATGSNPETPAVGGAIVGPGSILDDWGPNIDLHLPDLSDMFG